MAGIKGKSGGRRQGAGRPFASATFTPGSAQAEVNGVSVWVALDVDPHTGAIVIRLPEDVIKLTQKRTKE